MAFKKCGHASHQQGRGEGYTYTRHCPQCGEIVNTEANVDPNCASHHKERKGWGHRYCPDCGKRL